MLILVQKPVATTNHVTRGISVLRRIQDAMAGKVPDATWAKQEVVSPKRIGLEAASRQDQLRLHLQLHLRLQLHLQLHLCRANEASQDFWVTSRVKMLLC